MSEQQQNAIHFLEQAQPWTGRIVEYSQWGGYVVEITNGETDVTPERMFMDEPEGERSHEEIIADALAGFFARDDAERLTPPDDPIIDFVLGILEAADYFTLLETYITDGTEAVRLGINFESADLDDELQMLFDQEGYTADDAQRAIAHVEPAIMESLRNSARDMAADPDYRRKTARDIAVTLRVRQLLYGNTWDSASEDDLREAGWPDQGDELQTIEIPDGVDEQEFIGHILAASDIAEIAGEALSDTLRSFTESFFDYVRGEGHIALRKAIVRTMEAQRAAAQPIVALPPIPTKKGSGSDHQRIQRVPDVLPREVPVAGALADALRMAMQNTETLNGWERSLDGSWPYYTYQYDTEGGSRPTAQTTITYQPNDSLAEVAWQRLACLDDEALMTAWILEACWLRQAGKSYEQHAQISVDALLEHKGHRKHKKGGFRPEQKAEERARLRALSGILISLEGAPLWTKKNGKQRVAPILNVPFIEPIGWYGTKDLIDGTTSEPTALIYRLGAWIHPFLGSEQSYLSTALLFDGVLKMPAKEKHARRLGCYLTLQYRWRARHGNYDQTWTIQSICEKANIGIPPSAWKNPGRFRDAFERALDLNKEVGSVGLWEYDGKAPPKSLSFTDWLEKKIRIFPPAWVIGEYMDKATREGKLQAETALSHLVEQEQRSQERKAKRAASGDTMRAWQALPAGKASKQDRRSTT